MLTMLNISKLEWSYNSSFDKNMEQSIKAFIAVEVKTFYENQF